MCSQHSCCKRLDLLTFKAMTKSKTKLLTIERNFSIERSVVEKAAKELFAKMGIEYDNKRKPTKIGKTIA